MATNPTDIAGSAAATRETLCIRMSGHVQGVGFRPFVYRIAAMHGVTGHVQNQLGEVEIVATGEVTALARFQVDLLAKAPPLSRPAIDSVERTELNQFPEFSIAESSQNADAKIFVPADFFMCDDCRLELQDPADRRYRYPFINCTQCGPRYTLINALPYDRCNTSMAGFPLCDDCLLEYENPADRRFHAEPVACPVCGPQVSFAETGSDVVLTKDEAIAAAVGFLREGKIVAVKGIGGYHLLCDARDPDAVARLRARKKRPDKPLAVMFPVGAEDDLSIARQAVELTGEESELLRDPMRPIVLATMRADFALAKNLAPGLRELGVFLPYSPLHQLLLSDFGAPLVATSGNISGEPVLTKRADADARLPAIADAFLHHDRPIVRPADDSVYRRINGAMRPLRIGRGAAPREISLPWHQPEPVIAVGGHMKGTITLSWQDRAVVSPHIGEMDSPRSMAVFEQTVVDLQALYGIRAKRFICDAHPGYATTRWAHAQTLLPVVDVWHHHAHASAVAAEFAREGSWLVFTWDGVGMGEDGTLWGGEAFLGRPGDWQRACSFRPFHLPGGERAGREPWRSAAALNWAAGRAWPQCPDADGLALAAWEAGLNCPESSAVGRLFDAASALVCGAGRVSFEAQGPMLLEALCASAGEVIELPLVRDDDGVLRSDWEPLLPMLMNERLPAAQRAESFHSSMANALCSQVKAVTEIHKIEQVGLAGGVFQNRVLTDEIIRRLESDGYDVFINQQLPSNDAALSFGQAAEFAAREGRQLL